MPMKSIYRQPLTPEGIKKIESDTMDYFDDASWSNFNTGILEQYLDEKTRTDCFQESQWRWKSVIYGIILGMISSLIVQYVGLKVGFLAGGLGFVLYLTGLGFKWRPSEIGISRAAHGATTAAASGFVFTFPAIYLLLNHPNYTIRNAEGNLVHLINETSIPSIAVVIICVILSGILGILYFTLLRRIWIIEDPLPFPGFERDIKLYDIANDRAKGAQKMAIKSIRQLFLWAGVAGIFTFLRDFPVYNNKPFMDNLFGGDYYEAGMVMHPYATYTFFGWSLIPLQISVGWFMRSRISIIVASGSIFTWFLIVPMAVSFNVPIWIPQAGEYYHILDFPIITSTWSVLDQPAFVAAKRVAQPIAIGTILGGGLTALFKMSDVFKNLITDMAALSRMTNKKSEKITEQEWYEWPKKHVGIMWFVTLLGIFFTFIVLGGFPIFESFLTSILLSFCLLFITAIAIKTYGQTGSIPISGTSFIFLILLIGLYRLIGTDTSTLIIMALITTTAYGIALTISARSISDFKGSLYIGVRPYYLTKAQIISIPFGVIVAAIAALILSIGLSTIDPVTNQPVLDLEAPQAHAFATFTSIILGNTPWDWILIGIIIGIFVELLTGFGTAFGLGMYLPFYITGNLIVGGVLRDWWQKQRLEPKAKRLGWTEKEKTIQLLRTYMIATGVAVGEGLIGMIIAFYYVIPLITGSGP
jgi:uncharacterized oligopeptide transporter (OPT) family protein